MKKRVIVVVFGFFSVHMHAGQESFILNERHATNNSHSVRRRQANTVRATEKAIESTGNLIKEIARAQEELARMQQKACSFIESLMQSGTSNTEKAERLQTDTSTLISHLKQTQKICKEVDFSLK